MVSKPNKKCYTLIMAELTLNLNDDNILNLGLLEALARIRKFEKQIIKDKGEDITPKELNYLALIAHQKDIKQTDLLSILDVSKGTFSNMVKLLKKKGLVDQIIDSNDRRIKTIELTSKGKQMMELNNMIRKRIKKHILKKVTQQELDVFVGIVLKMR